MRSNDIENVITRKPIIAELARRGVYTLEQLATMTLEELQSIHGVGAKTAPRIRASAQAYVEDKPIWFGRIPESIRKPGAILDVRVDPDTLPQLPWGFCLSSPINERHYMIDMPELNRASQLKLPDGSSVSLIPRFHSAWQMIDQLASDNNWSIYYWGKAISRHVNETAPQKTKKALKRRMIDLHKAFMDAVALPIKSTGLVETATYLGYTNWPKENKPFMSYLAYLRWRRDQNRLDALQDALHRMAHNTDAISRIWWMISGNGSGS